MQLSRYGRRWYTQGLTTNLEATGWEASFDGGVTWVAGQRVGETDDWRWLLRGPDFDPTGHDNVESTEVTAAVSIPLLRAVAEPEVEGTDGTLILLT